MKPIPRKKRYLDREVYIYSTAHGVVEIPARGLRYVAAQETTKSGGSNMKILTKI